MDKNGGRPKKETTGFEKGKTTGYPQEETTGCCSKKPNDNVNVNDNDNVNVNDNDNVNVNDNDNVVSDSCVDGLQDIIKFYNNNFGPITPYAVELLNTYIQEMSSDLIIFAMQKAVEADKRTIQYIRGILNNWSKKGIKTVLEAKKEDEQFKNRNASIDNEKEETEAEKKARKIRELEESEKNGNS